MFQLEEVDLKLAGPTPDNGLDTGDEVEPRGNINCCMSFSQSIFSARYSTTYLLKEMIESLNGKSLFALGGEEGFWVGEPEKPNCQLSQNCRQRVF